jgi:hypothetical protein
MRVRQRRIDAFLERRYPRLYDSRHAASGFARALWPLLGPLVMAVILLPIIALFAGLVVVFDLRLPSVSLPELPLPTVTVPAWLQAIGTAIGAVFSALGAVAKYVFIVLAVGLGVHQTVVARHRRSEAERVGRDELMRRLAVALREVETVASDRRARRVGDLSRGDNPGAE